MDTTQITTPAKRLDAEFRKRSINVRMWSRANGINENVIYGLRSGRTPFSAFHDYRLCEALGLPLGYFIRGDGQ